MFLVFHFINWPNFIVWMPLLLEILGDMFFAIVCSPGCDIINFKINTIFLIKSFFYIVKKSRENLNFLWTKRVFKVKKKVFLINFEKFLVTNIFLRPESVLFRSLSTISKSFILKYIEYIVDFLTSSSLTISTKFVKFSIFPQNAALCVAYT